MEWQINLKENIVNFYKFIKINVISTLFKDTCNIKNIDNTYHRIKDNIKFQPTVSYRDN